jgi:hypothetical protein
MLPENATEGMRTVADFFRLVYGLRLSVDDDRPVPFAVDWVAEHTGLSPAHVGRIIRRLRDAATLVYSGTYGELAREGDVVREPRTRLFLPGLKGGPVVLERADAVETVLAVEPVAQREDLDAVEVAEVGPEIVVGPGAESMKAGVLATPVSDADADGG